MYFFFQSKHFQSNFELLTKNLSGVHYWDPLMEHHGSMLARGSMGLVSKDFPHYWREAGAATHGEMYPESG